GREGESRALGGDRASRDSRSLRSKVAIPWEVERPGEGGQQLDHRHAERGTHRVELGVRLVEVRGAVESLVRGEDDEHEGYAARATERLDLAQVVGRALPVRQAR